MARLGSLPKSRTPHLGCRVVSSLSVRRNTRGGVRIKRKPGIIFPGVELRPTREYDRERRRIAGLPRTQGEEAAITAVGVIDVSEREWSLSDALDMIERKACLVLEAAGLRKHVADYRKGRERPWTKAAFLSKVYPRQPRRAVSDEIVDALRALTLLRRVHEQLEQWSPYEELAYRSLNERPLSVRRSQVAGWLHSVVAAALELGIIADHFQVRPHEPELARDQKRQRGVRAGGRAPKRLGGIWAKTCELVEKAPFASANKLFDVFPDVHDRTSWTVNGFEVYRDSENDVLVQVDDCGRPRELSRRAFHRYMTEARKSLRSK
jgi:hypothetical protein